MTGTLLPQFAWPLLSQLSIKTTRISGSLPPAAANWSALATLDVSFSRVSGPLPTASWPLLRSLWATGSQLEGPLSDAVVQRWTAVENIYLGSTPMTGTLPARLGAVCAHLRELQLSVTAISGTIDAALSGCTALTLLDLSSTPLSGTVPVQIAQALTQLVTLRLTDTRLSGLLPSQHMGGMSRLSELSLATTAISGTLDAALGAMTQLTTLDIHATQIGGGLPAALANLTLLAAFYMDGSQITGSLAPAFAAWTALRSLRAFGTALDGELASALSAWTQLETLDLSGTAVSGTLSSGLSAGWSRLQRLLLAGTGVSGPLPDSVGGWSRLVELDLSSTKIEGTVPSTVSGWTSVQQVRLSQCRLVRATAALYGLANLASLSLADNRIAYHAEDCPTSGTQPNFVDLSGNPWNVSLATALSCVAYGHVTTLALDRMGLTDELAPSLGIPLYSMPVRSLSLRNNALSAPARSGAFGVTVALDSLDLSGNHLGASVVLDLFYPQLRTLAMSDTQATFCYDGRVLRSKIGQVSLRGERPSRLCQCIDFNRPPVIALTVCSASLRAAPSCSLLFFFARCIRLFCVFIAVQQVRLRAFCRAALEPAVQPPRRGCRVLFALPKLHGRQQHRRRRAGVDVLPRARPAGVLPGLGPHLSALVHARVGRHRRARCRRRLSWILGGPGTSQFAPSAVLSRCCTGAAAHACARRGARARAAISGATRRTSPPMRCWPSERRPGRASRPLGNAKQRGHAVFVCPVPHTYPAARLPWPTPRTHSTRAPRSTP